MKTYYALLLLAVFFAACNEEIIIKFDYPERRVVVNSLINPDSLFTVYVHKSAGVNDTAYEAITDAQVIVFNNNTEIETLKHEGVGVYKSQWYKPKAGEHYMLKVIAGNKTVLANETIPNIVNFINGSYVFPAGFDEEQEVAVASIEINDPPGENNYYEIIAQNIFTSYKYGHDENGHYVIVDTIYSISNMQCKSTNSVMIAEDILDYEPTTIFFSDKEFNGQNYVFSLKLNSTSRHIINGVIYLGTVKLTLRNISYDYYQYRRKFTQHQYNRNTSTNGTYNDFFNVLFPGSIVNPHSNIENGFGIFAGYNSVSDTLIQQ